MTVRCIAGAEDNTHPFSLTGLDADGNTITVGLIPVDNKGQDSIHSVRYSGYPVGTLSGEAGDGEFSHKRQPYGEFSRRNWNGGIGEINGLSDASKYWFGKRVWSVVKERMMLAPKLFRSTIAYPYRIGNETTINYPITWVSVPAANRVAWSVTTDYAGTGVDVLLRTLVDNSFTVRIRSDSAGSPGTVLSTVILSDAVIGSNRYQFGIAITAGTFWVDISGSAAFEIGTSAQIDYTCKTSADGTTYIASAMDAPVFFVYAATGMEEAIFFDYKWGKYAVIDSRLFINGDRGACDSNTGALSTLVDATKTWPTNCWVGAIVKLNDTVLGWRKVISNTATTITVDRPWGSAHTTDNWYVILGADRWTEITGHGLTSVTDAETVREDIVYFAQGPAVQMRRMREYNNAGTWTRDFAEDTQSTAGGALPGANFLVSTFDQLDGPVIYKIVNGDLGFIAKAPATVWGTNLVYGTEIKVGGDNWEDLSGGCNYDNKLAVTAMDSVWLIKNGYAEQVSIDMQSQWTRFTGRRPTVVPPYLVFPFGNRIQRLYGNIVESFGPERESSIPKRYDGQVMDNLTLVGGLVIAKDGGKAGVYDTDAEGGAYLYREGGWHPLAFTGLGSAMRALTYQHREDEMDMIWFADHNGLWYMYVPRGWDYTKDPMYDQTARIEQDGWFITGWFDTGQLLPAKWWDYVTVFADNLSVTYGRKVRLYYQVSDGIEYEAENLAANWTFAEEISTGYNNTITINKQGRRVRFLFLLMGDGNSTPIPHAYTMNYIKKNDDAESWQMAFNIKDAGYDKVGVADDFVTAKEKADILNYWARTVRPLTMHCEYPLWDNREVQISRPALVPLERSPELKTNFYSSLTIYGMEEPSEDPPGDIACPLDAPANGPYEVAMSGTIQPDQTTSISGAASYTIRTDTHTNITTYTLTGNWYGKDINDAWILTLDDDFYDVYAKDKSGNIIAIGVHDAVNPSTPGTRTGTFSADVATKIASIEVHIHGTSFRPTTAMLDGFAGHFWMNSAMNKGTLEWGYTEYGVWGRVSDFRVGPWQATASGWDYISWRFGSLLYFGNDNEFAGQTLAVRQMAQIVSAGAETALDAYGAFTECPIVDNYDVRSEKWYENFADFSGGSYTTAIKEFTVVPGTPAGANKAGATLEAYFNFANSATIDVGLRNFLWVHYPPANKITITSAALENVCP